MNVLRFGVVYGAPPFFEPEIEKMGYVDLEDLKISSTLKSEIERWNQQYQVTFNRCYG